MAPYSTLCTPQNSTASHSTLHPWHLTSTGAPHSALHSHPAATPRCAHRQPTGPARGQLGRFPASPVHLCPVTSPLLPAPHLLETPKHRAPTAVSPLGPAGWVPVGLVPGGWVPGGWVGAQTRTEPSGWSQPQRLLKVMRALRTWKRGISAGGTGGQQCHPDVGTLHHPAPPCPILTDLDREAGGQLEGDEVAQLGEVGVGDGHEVDDGCHLLCQGQRVLLAQPQRRLEPARAPAWAWAPCQRHIPWHPATARQGLTPSATSRGTPLTSLWS